MLQNEAIVEIPRRGAESDTRSTATFIGNATVLFRLGGITILTDPSFLHAGDHVHVGYGIFAKRRLEPALQPSALPPLDAVVLSHLHADHWDRVAEHELSHDLPLVTTPQAAAVLRKRGFPHTYGLELRNSLTLRDAGERAVRITAVPAQHGPRPLNKLLPQTHGHVFEASGPAARTMRIYVSGDTLIFDDIRQIATRLQKIDVAFIHLGGTRIPHQRLGVLVTLDAKGGIALMRILDPRYTVPIHTDDWSLFSSGLDEFLTAARDANLSERVRVIGRGEEIDVTTLLS